MNPEALPTCPVSYKYFIAYQFDHGFGNCELTRSRPITSFEDVQGISKIIQADKKLKEKVIVSNWILL